MKLSTLVLLVALLGIANFAVAVPSINWPTFTYNAPFQMNGGAPGVSGGALLLTTNSGQTRSIFVNTPQDLTQSFSAQYTFWMGSGYYSPQWTNGTAAGGLAFVIQADPRTTTALGGAGNQLGYGDGAALNSLAIQNSFALGYSTFSGSDQFKLYTNGANANLDTLTAALATQSGSENLTNAVSNILLTYEAPDITYPNGAVTVLLNGNSIGLNNVPLPASLVTLAGGNTGYFGFTATTDTAPDGPYTAVRSLIAGAPAPEPATLSLLALGGLGLIRRGRKV